MDVSSITLHLPHWRASGSRWLITSCRIFNILIILATALGHQTIRCSDVELVQLNPPDGMSCAQYMDPFISSVGVISPILRAFVACQLLINFLRRVPTFSTITHGVTSAWYLHALLLMYVQFSLRSVTHILIYIDYSCVYCILLYSVCVRGACCIGWSYVLHQGREYLR